MQGRHPVDGAISALKELRSAYRALFRAPTETTMDACRQCHKEAIEVLREEELGERLAALIKQTEDSKQATVEFALKNLERAQPWELQIERELGGALGFTSRQVDGFVKEAKRGLKSALSRQRTPELPKEAAGWAKVLDAFHQPMVDLADSLRKKSGDGVLGQKPPRRGKQKAKNQGRKLTDRQLFLVGSVIANGKVADVFPRSYAISLGLVAAAER